MKNKLKEDVLVISQCHSTLILQSIHPLPFPNHPTPMAGGTVWLTRNTSFAQTRRDKKKRKKNTAHVY